jgi:hypothetical protein
MHDECNVRRMLVYVSTVINIALAALPRLVSIVRHGNIIDWTGRHCEPRSQPVVRGAAQDVAG